jgi:hypothetical protein
MLPAPSESRKSREKRIFSVEGDSTDKVTLKGAKGEHPEEVSWKPAGHLHVSESRTASGMHLEQRKADISHIWHVARHGAQVDPLRYLPSGH